MEGLFGLAVWSIEKYSLFDIMLFVDIIELSLCYYYYYFFLLRRVWFLQSVNTVSPIWPCFPSCPGTPCSPFGPWIIFGIVKDAIRAVALQVHVPGSPFFPGGPCSILISLSLQIYTLSTKGKLCYVRWWVTNG